MLEETGDLKTNYWDYMTTEPINCNNEELKRLESADYIAEVKRNLGLPMYDAPNAVEELKQPRKHPTAEKVEAIKDALKHFELI